MNGRTRWDARARSGAGWSVEQAARRLGVSPDAYRAPESAERWPDWETYDGIERLFGWTRTFVG
jgi:transcriptional regulator with XRE-family HTH domain